MTALNIEQALRRGRDCTRSCKDKERGPGELLCVECIDKARLELHAFWRQHHARVVVDRTQPPAQWKVCIVDGTFYSRGQEPSERARANGDAGFLGFGGRKFHVRYTNGTEFISHNLWTAGEIPLEYLEVIPDDAVFVEGTGAVKLPPPPKVVTLGNDASLAEAFWEKTARVPATEEVDEEIPF